MTGFETAKSDGGYLKISADRLRSFQNRGGPYVSLDRLPACPCDLYFLIQHAVEIFVTFKLRGQQEPAGIPATYAFMLDNNSRNLRITYSLIIVTGMIAGFLTTWWRQGWMWTAFGVMILLWFVMRRIGSSYLYAVDAITDQAIKNQDEPASLDKFRSDLRARREPEILTITSVIGGSIILWLMMFKPF